MSKILLSVNEMSCQHCVRAIEQAVGEIEGTKEVLVDLETKEVSVIFDEKQVSIAQIVNVIEEAGYEVDKRQLVGV
jgi:copper chaperone